MSVTLLKDVLISLGQLDRYFEGRTPVHLWRAHDPKKKPHPMDIVEEAFVRSDGKGRPPDITIEAVQGVAWVRVKTWPRGLSTWDKKGIPRGKNWTYYLISQGTPLPQGLALVLDYHNPDHDANHYTIAPDRDMPLETFRGLLRELFVKMSREVG